MEAKQPDANSFFEDEYRLLPLSSQLKPTFGNGRYQLHGDETANGRGVIAYIVDTGFGVSKHDSEKSPVIADVLKNILKPQIYKNDVWPDATEELHGTAIACIVNRIVPEAQIAPWLLLW